MEIVDVINNDLYIEDKEIKSFIKAHIDHSSYNLFPNYYEGVIIREEHVEKIRKEYQNGKISRWEYMYILSLIETYLLLWDEENPLISIVSEEILFLENKI